MKGKMILAFFFVLVLATWAIFVSAQGQPQPTKDEERIKALETRVERLEGTVAGLQAQIAALRNPPATARPVR